MITVTANKGKRANKAVRNAKAQIAPETVEPGRDALVPLSLLVLDDANVRKTYEPSSIPELAALVAANGLMQRLAVIDAGNGVHNVVAGGRRLRALWYLRDAGEIAADAPIECKVYESSRALQLSLAENSGREAMHPADQMEAFKALIDDNGLTVAQVAHRFGVTPLTVERRLKLARISPRFILMYRQGEIAADQLMALAISDDHAAQEAAWDSASVYNRSAYQLRETLTEDECKADSKLARFVGLVSYKEAGGAVRVDLFGEDDGDVYLQDAALLRALALKRLEVDAASVKAEGWVWVECSLDSDSTEYRCYGRERVSAREATVAEAEGFARLEAERRAKEQALEEHFDNGDEDAEGYEATSERLEKEVDEATAAAEAAGEVLFQWSPEQLARAGALVRLSYNGVVQVDRGLVRPGDKKAAIASMVQAGEKVPPAMLKGARAAFSEGLMKDMTAHRTAALQAAMTQNPRVALVALVHRMASDLLLPHKSYENHACTLKVSLRATSSGALAQDAADYAESPAEAVLAAAEIGWDERLPDTTAALFAWLMAQDQSVLLDLLAYCTARSLSAVHGREDSRDDSAQLAAALGVRMADWWTPTPAKYLGRVSKAKAIEAVIEATGIDETKKVGAMKKDEAIAYCAARLDGKGWLPSPLK